MYTRCPACLTVFRISSADLRAADGEVVCGRCDAQFNALTSLSETPEEATVVLRPTGDAEGGDGDLDLSQTGAEPLWDVVARGAVAAGQPGRAADPESTATESHGLPGNEAGDESLVRHGTDAWRESLAADETLPEGTEARAEPDQVAPGTDDAYASRSSRAEGFDAEPGAGGPAGNQDAFSSGGHGAGSDAEPAESAPIPAYAAEADSAGPGGAQTGDAENAPASLVHAVDSEGAGEPTAGPETHRAAESHDTSPDVAALPGARPDSDSSVEEQIVSADRRDQDQDTDGEASAEDTGHHGELATLAETGDDHAGEGEPEAGEEPGDDGAEDEVFADPNRSTDGVAADEAGDERIEPGGEPGDDGTEDEVFADSNRSTDEVAAGEAGDERIETGEEPGDDGTEDDVFADPNRSTDVVAADEAGDERIETGEEPGDDGAEDDVFADSARTAEADGGETVFSHDDEGDLVSVDVSDEDSRDAEAESMPDDGLGDESEVFDVTDVFGGDEVSREDAAGVSSGSLAEASRPHEGPTEDENEITFPAGVTADDEDTVPGGEPPGGEEDSADVASQADEDDSEGSDDADLEAALEAELNALADQAAEEWAVATGVNEQPDFAASEPSRSKSATADEATTGAVGTDAVEEAAVEIDIDDDGLDIAQQPETRTGDHPTRVDDGAEGREIAETSNDLPAGTAEDADHPSDDGDIDDSDLEFDVPQDQWDQIWDSGPDTGESRAARAAGSEDAGEDPADQDEGSEAIVLESGGEEADDLLHEPSLAKADDGFAMPGTSRPAPFAENAERPPNRSRWWLAAAVLLGLSLGLQWVHYNRASLLTHPSLGPALGGLYESFGIEARPAWELGSFRILESAGVQDPANPGTLKLSVRFSNSAAVPQPLPLLRVTLEDRWGEPVAMRDFAPREYIASVTEEQRLSPGKATQGNVTIVDPGPTADGYRLDLCYPDGSQGAYCLGDLPGR